MKVTTYIVALIVALASYSAAQELPFSGDIRTATLNELSEECLLSLAAEHRGSGSLVWVGYLLEVRPAFHSLVSRGEIEGSHFSGTMDRRHAMPSYKDGITFKSSSEKLLVFQVSFKLAKGSISEARIYSTNAELEFSKPMVHVTNMDQERSLELVLQLMADGSNTLKEHLAPLIAVHPQEEALIALEKTIINDGNHEAREEALQWLGMAVRGSDTDRMIAVFDALDDARLRESAIYPLYSTGCIDKIFEVAESDSSSDVREQAYFWLGVVAGNKLSEQTGDANKASEEERSKVFTLYQMDTRESRAMLKRVALEGNTTGVRKQAIFWLAQDPDADVLAMLKQIVKR